MVARVGKNGSWMRKLLLSISSLRECNVTNESFPEIIELIRNYYVAMNTEFRPLILRMWVNSVLIWEQDVNLSSKTYSNGLSEVILGNAIKELQLPREEIVVMTKVLL